MKAMKPMFALLRVLSLFALLGMLIAPVSTIAAEYAMAGMSMKASVQTEEMAVMMGDMPCCPDEQPVKPDCDKSCPFVIICSTSVPLALLKADWTSASGFDSNTGLFIADVAITGLTSTDIVAEANSAIATAIESEEDDDFYLLVSDGTDAVLAKIGDSDDDFTSADVTIVATLLGLSAADLQGLSSSQFVDWNIV